jgi:hypothetical protein
MDIWAACKEAVVPGSLKGELIRVVESQEQIATRTLVDDLAEQALLEDLLEMSKPPLPADSAHLDYLLSSPFRYPPLAYGSRFGSRHEPSLFYGALDVAPALAETAYYRLVFWSGMSITPPTGRLTTEHTLFAARYETQRGVKLNKPPFDTFTSSLIDPKSYRDTQLLGHHLREAGIEAFEYLSARDPGGGMNIALFTARAFAEPAPRWKQSWLCDTRGEEVTFYNKTQGTWLYRLTEFLVDGVLPSPPD